MYGGGWMRSELWTGKTKRKELPTLKSAGKFIKILIATIFSEIAVF